jgi:uncharacterized SAM-binding protein YcdF (DUF218 family)
MKESPKTHSSKARNHRSAAHAHVPEQAHAGLLRLRYSFSRVVFEFSNQDLIHLMDSLFFYLSKLFWLFIAQDSLLLFLALLVWLMWWRGKIHAAKTSLNALLIILLLLAFFPVGEWLLYPLENHFRTNPDLPQKIDGIMVLGGPESETRSEAWNQVELKDSAERLLAGMALARQHPEAKLVFTSGTGSLLHPQYRGADVGRKLFEQQGIDLSQVLLERNSRNTHENALFSKALLNPRPGETWVLVTTASHMPRSVGIFCQQDWPMIPYPVDHHTWKGHLLRLDFNLALHLVDLGLAVNEWVGLAAYRLTGKTTALMPLACH